MIPSHLMLLSPWFDGQPVLVFAGEVVVSGPYYVAASQVYLPGAVASEAYLAGAIKSQVYLSGAGEQQGNG